MTFIKNLTTGLLTFKFILKANLRKDVIRDGLMSSKKKTLIPSAAAVMNHYILMFLYPPVDWNQRQQHLEKMFQTSMTI